MAKFEGGNCATHFAVVSEKYRNAFASYVRFLSHLIRPATAAQVPGSSNQGSHGRIPLSEAPHLLRSKNASLFKARRVQQSLPHVYSRTSAFTGLNCVKLHSLVSENPNLVVKNEQYFCTRSHAYLTVPPGSFTWFPAVFCVQYRNTHPLPILSTLTPSRAPNTSFSILEIVDALTNVYERTKGTSWKSPEVGRLVGWRPVENNTRIKHLENWTGVKMDEASNLVELRMKNMGLEGETPRGIRHKRPQNRRA